LPDEVFKYIQLLCSLLCPLSAKRPLFPEYTYITKVRGASSVAIQKKNLESENSRIFALDIVLQGHEWGNGTKKWAVVD
jgi:hypothetical protein